MDNFKTDINLTTDNQTTVYEGNNLSVFRDSEHSSAGPQIGKSIKVLKPKRKTENSGYDEDDKSAEKRDYEIISYPDKSSYEPKSIIPEETER